MGSCFDGSWAWVRCMRSLFILYAGLMLVVCGVVSAVNVSVFDTGIHDRLVYSPTLEMFERRGWTVDCVNFSTQPLGIKPFGQINIFLFDDYFFKSSDDSPLRHRVLVCFRASLAVRDGISIIVMPHDYFYAMQDVVQRIFEGVDVEHSWVLMLSKLSEDCVRNAELVRSCMGKNDGIWLNRVSRFEHPYAGDEKEWYFLERPGTGFVGDVKDDFLSVFASCALSA